MHRSNKVEIMHINAAQNDSAANINMNTIALQIIIGFHQIFVGEIPKQSRKTFYYTYLKLIVTFEW
jgi:hypothetical protein